MKEFVATLPAAFENTRMTTSDALRKFALLLILIPIPFGWLAPWFFLACFGVGLTLLVGWWVHAVFEMLLM